MKSSTLVAVLAATAVVASTSVHASACSTEQVATADAIVATNKAMFQLCVADLKTATSSATSFISTAYVSASGAAPICASENCVKALIVAMEKLPDCCSPASASSAATNLPRLADDILHQCDLIDEKLLGAELEREIAKLPDLKVQIKSVKATTNGSGSGVNNASVGDVDVVIDVKKRELMKSGATLGNNSSSSTNVEPSSSTTSLAVAMQTPSVLALSVALVAALAVLA